MSPTGEMYGDLDRAYRFYNERLFDNQLPDCLITLRARGRTNGYYCRNRFIHPDGRHTSEIALNPERFATRTIEQCLSTLVHEQVHLWQDVLGTAPNRVYHNRDFADRMEAIGLVTSHTGRPGGRRTGQKISHYIAADGRFLLVTRELLDESFRARWADTFVHDQGDEGWKGWQEPPNGQDVPVPLDPTPEPEGSEGAGSDAAPVEATVVETGTEPAEATPEPSPPAAAREAPASPEPDPPPTQNSAAATAPEEGSDVIKPWTGPSQPMIAVSPTDFTTPARENSARSKSKWSCPACGDNAWGKPSLQILCMKCSKPMRIASAIETEHQPD